MRITPYVAWAHRVPSAVENEIFKNDISNMRVEIHKDWVRTPTAFIIESHPEVLNNTNEADDSHRNIVHIAALVGCAGFLELFIRDVALNSNDLEDKKRVLTACLTKDNNNRTPLFYAVESQDTSCVTAILDCLMLAFDDMFAFLNIECATYVHLADLFPLDDLIYTIEKFPAIGLRYLGKVRGSESRAGSYFYRRRATSGITAIIRVSNHNPFRDSLRSSQLKLINAYDSRVLKNCERIPLEEDQKVVRGSSERSPVGFWQKGEGGRGAKRRAYSNDAGDKNRTSLDFCMRRASSVNIAIILSFLIPTLFAIRVAHRRIS